LSNAANVRNTGPWRTNVDKIDRTLLRELQANGRLTNADLAARVNLSASACLRRIQRLESAGVICGNAARISADAIGRAMTVFVEVTLDNQGSKALDAFERAMAACHDVLECHLISGDFDYLLRVAVADVADYERVHRNQVGKLPHVAPKRTSRTDSCLRGKRGLCKRLRESATDLWLIRRRTFPCPAALSLATKPKSTSHRHSPLRGHQRLGVSQSCGRSQ
jgi:Lrp/AsnC family transcriptional regulator, leucine-responsive regulatory protein